MFRTTGDGFREKLNPSYEMIGGSNNTIALQPLSVQGQVGLSVAAGLESLELRPGR